MDAAFFIAVAVIVFVFVKYTIPNIQAKRLLKKGRKIRETMPPPPRMPENKLLAYRKGGSQWVEYYAQTSSIESFLRMMVAMKSAEEIRQLLSRDYLEIPCVRLAYTQDQVQFTYYYISASQPESHAAKLYREHIGEQAIRTSTSVKHEYVPAHITFSPEDQAWMYRATLANLIDIPEEYLSKAMYMHDGVIYKNVEHYRLYTNWRNQKRG